MKLRALVSSSLIVLALGACEPSAPTAGTTAPALSAANAPRNATPAPAAPAATDNVAAPATAALMLPGDFAPDTSPDELRKRYGAANVRLGKVPGAEGEEFPGVILFPDDPTRRAYLYFQNDQTLQGLSLVRVLDRESRWTLDNGLRMGMPLAEMVELNGKPISFYGLEWDYGGTIVDYHGGKLDARKDEQVGRSASLGLLDNGGQGIPQGKTPVGEGTYSSDDPKYPEQGKWIVISELSASFPGEDDL
ncbi:hypothetical protein ASD78_05040 [Lysobacter sp. Root667]|uniref:hypothetical protein n=1 Tax=Lysobacter sp. Root667 TaxID=1736581 RepID=UPI0006FEFD2B|nr:hypothetical protein [Lysobacter sp. Root667]KRA76980.1 hypothetical protein ASD78_05040 [Lysobacter sp. Root667]